MLSFDMLRWRLPASGDVQRGGGVQRPPRRCCRADGAEPAPAPPPEALPPLSLPALRAGGELSHPRP